MQALVGLLLAGAYVLTWVVIGFSRIEICDNVCSEGSAVSGIVGVASGLATLVATLAILLVSIAPPRPWKRIGVAVLVAFPFQLVAFALS